MVSVLVTGLILITTSGLTSTRIVSTAAAIHAASTKLHTLSTISIHTPAKLSSIYIQQSSIELLLSVASLSYKLVTITKQFQYASIRFAEK